ncbi:MAG: hypothetical protein U0R71_13495 [Solirubrobacterales bacterium]
MKSTRIFALLAILTALAALLAGCGGGGSEDPKAVVEQATLEGLESGKLEVKASISSQGESGGNVDLSLAGPFQSGGKGNLPQLSFQLSAKGDANGEPVDFEGGLTMLSDRAFVGLKGTEYEVDPTTFGFMKSGFERAAQEGTEKGEGGATTACQKAVEGLDFEKLLDNVESEGSADVGGTSTTKVSGDVNVGASLDALITLLETPACSAQLEAAGGLGTAQLQEAKGELSSAIKKSHVELYVGDDHIVRKLAVEMTIEPKGSGESVEMNFEMTLSGVNEDQTIEAPQGAKPLEDLFRELGVNPLELLEGGSGGLGGLMEALGGGGGLGGLGGGESSGGGESAGGGESSSGGLEAAQREYVECLQGAETPADLQKCASLLK